MIILLFTEFSEFTENLNRKNSIEVVSFSLFMSIDTFNIPVEMKWILVKHPDNAQSTTVRMRVEYDVSYVFYWLLLERCESAQHFFMQELRIEAEEEQAEVDHSKCYYRPHPKDEGR